MGIVPFGSEAEWHRLRAQNIGASEVAALFDLSPWTTKWKLFMQKSGQLPEKSAEAWMNRGRHFEPAIASYAKEEFGLDIVKVKDYWTDDACPGLGASFDYTLADDMGVPVEIKWVERYDGWDWTGDECTLAPDAYLLQVQHQMACSGASRGILIPFVGGTVRRMTIPRSEPIIGAIRTNVTEFWNDIAAKKAPPVDFLKDSDSIFDLARFRPLRTIELPPQAANLFQVYLDEKAACKVADDRVTAAQAELVKMVLDAGMGNDGQAVASCGDFTMKLTQVADNPGKLVTPDMIGTLVGTRKGHLRCTIGKKKDKK